MERDERYEVNSEGAIVVGTPITLTPTERKNMIERMFSINGWEYTLYEEVTSAHFFIELKNDNLQITKRFHLYHGNIRKEDPDRNREEKKIQLGTENDPRGNMEDSIILGFYVYENKTSLEDTIIVAWPIESGKNYPANPSLRVNMRTEIMPAKNSGYYIDKTSGKKLVAFRPEFIYHYIQNYKNIQYNVPGCSDGQNGSASPIKYVTGLTSEFSRNRILFGAPGTGKSFAVNSDCRTLIGEDNENDYERVTFHPDYSYANFVGTYKPIPCKDDEGKESITYEYVPGPFMRVLVKALQNSKTDKVKPFLLIVEEINRANVAAVFGDVFQLLDRGENEASEYSITTSNDMRAYLAKDENLGGNPNDYEKIRIPDNMFIWATMNSADQGVYPMDTAFKRRWDFKYLGIDKNDSELEGKVVTLGTGSYSRTVEWNSLRKAINKSLSSYKVNEDKLLGPYFLSKKIVIPNSGDEINSGIFIDAFKNKVLMYLFDDAAKQKRQSLFEGCKDTTKYSSICSDFDKKGIDIFCKEIRDKFPKPTTENTESSEAEE